MGAFSLIVVINLLNRYILNYDRKLFKCSLQSCLNFANLSADTEFRKLLCGKPRFICCLALYVLYLRKHNSSVSQSWLDEIPKTFDSLWFTKSNDVITLLPDCLKSECSIMKERFDIDFAIAKKFCALPFEYNDFVWAFSLVHTRCIKWPNKIEADTLACDNEIDYALIPFADFFNHDPSCKVTTEVEDGHFIIKSEKEQFAGEQAFINYGNHSNAYFLLQYGFVPENNKFDFIEFTLDQMLHVSQYSNEDKKQIAHVVKDNYELFNKPYLYINGLSRSLLILVYVVIAENDIWPRILENPDREIRLLTDDYHTAASGLFNITLQFVKDYVCTDRDAFNERCKKFGMRCEDPLVVIVTKFFENWISILDHTLEQISKKKLIDFQSNIGN